LSHFGAVLYFAIQFNSVTMSASKSVANVAE